MLVIKIQYSSGVQETTGIDIASLITFYADESIFRMVNFYPEI